MLISLSSAPLTNALGTTPPIYAEGVSYWVIECPTGITSTSIDVYGSVDGVTFRRLRDSSGAVTITIAANSLVEYVPDVSSLAHIKLVTNADDSSAAWAVLWETPEGQMPTATIRPPQEPYAPGDPT